MASGTPQLFRREKRSGRRPPATRQWWIHVVGFKSVRDPLDIELRPLTVLCGANSSGKSSAIQPLLMLKQTLEVAYDPGPLLLAGGNVSFSTAREMLWHGRGGDVATQLTVGFTDFDQESTTLTFKLAPHGVELDRLEYTPAQPSERERAFVLRTGAPQSELRQAVDPDLQELVSQRRRSDPGFEVRLRRSRCFFDVVVVPDSRATQRGPALPTFTATDYSMLVSRATNLIHLPGLRDNPARFYPATQVGGSFPGVFQPYVASVIATWAERRDQRLKALGDQMQRLGLTWKVESKRIDDTRVALRVGRLTRPTQGGARDMVNIADVGLGVSQTLPVVVALLAAQPGQIVYLEQPEIHLHPRAQVALATLLLDAAQRGVVVVAETHSYLLLRGIQEVAARSNATEMVKLHWFTRDETGVTRVDSGDLDSAGAFGDWPADFADVELDIEEQYVKTAVDRLAR